MISYRKADIFKRVQVQNEPVTVTFLFQRAQRDVLYRGSEMTYGRNQKEPTAAEDLVKKLESHLTTMSHIRQNGFTIIREKSLANVVGSCVTFLSKLPQYISHDSDWKDVEGTGALLIVKVKPR